MRISHLALAALSFGSGCLSIGACGDDPTVPSAAAASPDAGPGAAPGTAPGPAPSDGGPTPVPTEAGTTLAATMVPMPLVSRGKRFVASTGDASHLSDGLYMDARLWESRPTTAKPAWVAIDVGAGPTTLLLNWAAPRNGGYMTTNDGVPRNYRIETSATSTNGADGAWTTVVTVKANPLDARAHSFAFAGRRWVRFVAEEPSPDAGGRVAIGEIDVHDASKGIADTWLFLGDSITALTMNRGNGTGSFAEKLHAAKPAFFPAMIGGGTGGTNTDDAVKHIDEWIALNPDMKYWGLSYGTNDMGGRSAADVAKYEKNLRTIIGKLRAAKRVPVLPRVPYSKSGSDGQFLLKFNAVVDKLRAEFGLPTGPDLYAWFQAHPNELADDIHPGNEGGNSLCRLWAEAMTPLYP